jgi:hypothetical protein
MDGGNVPLTIARHNADILALSPEDGGDLVVAMMDGSQHGQALVQLSVAPVGHDTLQAYFRGHIQQNGHIGATAMGVQGTDPSQVHHRTLVRERREVVTIAQDDDPLP